MDSHLNLLDVAVNHHLSGRNEAAERAYAAALAADPADARALHLLGVLKARRSDADGAIRLLVRAVRIDPMRPEALAHLGGALLKARRVAAAISVLRRAVILDPGVADAVEILGAAGHAVAEYGAAAVWSLRAHRLRPWSVDAAINLGAALRDARKFAAADACFLAAIERDGGSTPAHLGLAVSRLVQGDFAVGLAEFEWRWKRRRAPEWKGEPLAGRRLLLYAEQGFGDAIQFVRYAPRVTKAVGPVAMVAHPMLARLFHSLHGDVELAGRGEDPPHDVECPLMSLPHLFGTTIGTIPAEIPYLRPVPEDVARWDRRLAGAGGLRVGLVWAGNPAHANDRNRSLPAELMASLLEIEGIRFFSLQMGEARSGLKRLPGVEDLTEDLRDFADTAAILANLDLLIAADTAALHLAGALGRPAWGLIAYAPDWRWLLDRTDSPWYPTLRLFRQPKAGDWPTVLASVGAGLRLAVRKNPTATLFR